MSSPVPTEHYFYAEDTHIFRFSSKNEGIHRT